MHRENGLNSYGSLSTWLSANGYNKLQDLLTAFGANGMVGGTLRNTLCAKESLDFDNTGCIDIGSITGWFKYATQSGYDRWITSALDSITKESGKSISTAFATFAGIATYTTTNITIGGGTNRTSLIVPAGQFASSAEISEYYKGQLLAYEKP